MISQEDNVIERQPHRKTNFQEDSITGERNQREMTIQKLVLTGKRPHRKMNSNENRNMTAQEVDLIRRSHERNICLLAAPFFLSLGTVWIAANGRQPQLKRTSMEDKINGRQNQWKTTLIEDNLN